MPQTFLSFVCLVYCVYKTYIHILYIHTVYTGSTVVIWNPLSLCSVNITPYIAQLSSVPWLTWPVAWQLAAVVMRSRPPSPGVTVRVAWLSVWRDIINKYIRHHDKQLSVGLSVVEDTWPLRGSQYSQTSNTPNKNNESLSISDLFQFPFWILWKVK